MTSRFRLKAPLGVSLVSILLAVGCGKSSSDPTHSEDTSSATIKAKTATTLSAPVGTLNIPADAFVDGTKVSLVEGFSLQKDKDTASLIPAANITASGTTALVASVVKTNATVPMTIIVPLPTVALADATNSKKIIVLFKYFDYDTTTLLDIGYWATDKFADHGIQVNADGTVTFTSIYLGAYQIVVTKEAINQSLIKNIQGTILDASKNNPFPKTTLQLFNPSRLAPLKY